MAILLVHGDLKDKNLIGQRSNMCQTELKGDIIIERPFNKSYQV